MKVTIKKKPAVLCLTILAGILFTWGIADLYLDYKEELEVRQKAKQTLAFVDLPPQAGFHEKADTIRDFIFQNSEHSEDEEFYEHWRDVPLMYSKLIAYLNDKENNEPVHLECSTRSTLAVNMLHSLGIETRSVSIYRQTENYPGHTFYEIYNTETQRWEIQDPDFNIFWRDKKNNRRASIYDMIEHPMSQFEACTFTEKCGAEHLPARTIKLFDDLKTRFALASIIDRDIGERPLLYNKARFDLEKKIKVGDKMITYCEHMDKNCRQEIIGF